MFNRSIITSLVAASLAILPVASPLAMASGKAKPAVAAASGEITYARLPSGYDKLKDVKKGGIYYQRLSNNPKVINPILSADANSSALEPYLWATLFTEDTDTLNPLPYLADGYKISADKTTYTFFLNKDAKWSDGSSVTTDDVKFTFDTMMSPKTEAAALRSFWEGTTLEVVDGHTFKFVVKEPRFDSLRSLYLLQTIQKKQFEKEADFNKSKGVMEPVGNGPYKFKAFSRDQQLTMELDKSWWGSKLPHFKNRFNAQEIVFRIITDDTLCYEKFLKGELDVTTFNAEQFSLKVNGSDKEKFGTSSKDKKVVWAKEIQNKAPRGFTYIGWNLRQPLFQSKKTRQALALIVDYKQIIDKVFFGYAFQCTSPFGSLTYNAAEDLRNAGKMLTTDRKKAMALLKEDGWADSDGDNVLDKTIDGKKVKFAFELKFNSNNPLRAKIAQIAKENFKVAGIDMSVRAMEWNAYLEDVDNRRFDAYLLAWTATPYPNAKQIWHTSSEKDKGSNIVGFSNAKVDELIDLSNKEFDLKKRAETMKEINRILYDEQPYLFLSEPRSVLAGFNTKVNSTSGSWAMAYDISPPDDIYTYAQ